MRLFKGGGIGLGPYAFAPTGEGCWRRIATGAPATRPGGYRLERGRGRASWSSSARALEARPDPDSALTWAVGRFEMGCERESALDGLSDHLLAMRAVLEGHGPVGASLPMRAAALISDEDRWTGSRPRERVEDALELERALMNGRPVEGADRARRLGRGGRPQAAAPGRPRRARQRPQHRRRRDPDRHRPGRRRRRDHRLGRGARPSDRSPSPTSPRSGAGRDLDRSARARAVHRASAARRQRPRRTTWSRRPASWSRFRPKTRSRSRPRHGSRRSPTPAAATRSSGRPTPSATSSTARRIDTPRVRHLFPVPEDADWEVSHLEFEYSGRAR